MQAGSSVCPLRCQTVEVARYITLDEEIVGEREQDEEIVGEREQDTLNFSSHKIYSEFVLDL